MENYNQQSFQFKKTEPGYYEEGSFGIRLENIVRVVNSTVTDKNGRPFLAIQDMTFLPYQHKLIKKSLLTKAEVSNCIFCT